MPIIDKAGACVALIVVGLGMRPGVALACVGDCNGDGTVAINELIVGVNIALGTADPRTCVAFQNSTGAVNISQLIIGVNNALNGCAGGPSVDAGLQALASGNLRTAAAVFAAALAADRQNDAARFYATLSQSAAHLIDSAALRTLVQRGVGGVTGDSNNVCALRVSSGGGILASAPGTDEILDALRQVVRPEIEQILSDLARVAPDTAIRFPLNALPSCVRLQTDTGEVKIDQGDLLSARAALEFVLGALDLVGGYDIAVPLYTLVNETALTILTFQPQLLTLVSAGNLASAQQHLGTALGLATQAIDALLAETGDQSDDLLVIEAADIPDAQRLRFLAAMFKLSLSGEVSLPIDTTTGQVDLTGSASGPHERLNLSPLFTGHLTSLRGLLPGFDGAGDFDGHRLMDPTFAGMAPDMTQSKIDHFLAGGPQCAACTSDTGCNAYGFGRFYCSSCESECQSDVLRCVDGFTECSDGFFY